MTAAISSVDYGTVLEFVSYLLGAILAMLLWFGRRILSQKDRETQELANVRERLVKIETVLFPEYDGQRRRITDRLNNTGMYPRYDE